MFTYIGIYHLQLVLLNLITRDNISDAVLRLIIGVIAAGVLYLLLHSDLDTITIAGAKLSGDALTREKAVVIGFIAGFLERLVPDLLAGPTATGQATALPAPVPAGGPMARGGAGEPPPPPSPGTPPHQAWHRPRRGHPRLTHVPR